jgi:hypothetical protein
LEDTTMKRPKDTATVAKINDPSPKGVSPRAKKSSPKRRTVAPTPTSAAREAETKGGTQEKSDESPDPDGHSRAAADELARGFDAAAQSIRNADHGALADDLAAFARRQPLAAFGAAALLGFAAGQLLKTPGQVEDDDPSDRS